MPQQKPLTDSPLKTARVLLAGYGHLGMALLDGLVNTPDVAITGVFRWSQSTGTKNTVSGFSVEPVEKQFGEKIKQYGLHEIRCQGINSYEFVRVLQELKPDILLIGSWGEILKPHVLDLPELTVINCHPSKLPAHRGANPYISAVRAGESESGVTFHVVTPDIDAGPVILQAAVAIDPNDTGGDLREHCAEKACLMVPALIQRISGSEGLETTPQNTDGASYFKPLNVADGRLNWDEAPSTICNQVRGLQPWLDGYGFVNGRRMLTFNKARLQTGQPSDDTPAGIIMGIYGNELAISTTQPQTTLLLTLNKLQIGPILVFSWLSKILLPFFVKPGSRLEAQTPKR